MGRALRIQECEIHYHIIVRCNNESFRFECDQDFEHYLQVLRRCLRKHQFKLFNYELMHSHVHLFLQPSKTFSLEKTMHFINGTFAREYNLKKKRKGHLWLDRYKNIPVESDKYALDLMRYINRNALRAGLVDQVGQWPWSGYNFYAYGQGNDLLETHPTYLGLSENKSIRQKAFRDYVEQSLPCDQDGQNSFSCVDYVGSAQFAKKLGLSTGY